MSNNNELSSNLRYDKVNEGYIRLEMFWMSMFYTVLNEMDNKYMDELLSNNERLKSIHNSIENIKAEFKEYKDNSDDEADIWYIGSYFLEEDANGILVSLEPKVLRMLEELKEKLSNDYKEDMTISEAIWCLYLGYKGASNDIFKIREIVDKRGYLSKGDGING